MLFQEITAEEFAEIRAKEAYNDGLKDGFDNGFSDGEKAGFKNGFNDGEKAGAQKKQLEIASSFKKAGIPLEVIAENTGLSKEQIEEL